MKALKLFAFLLVVAGAALSAKGAWIPAKAWLAGHMLDAAFSEARTVKAPQKPWRWADFRVAGELRIKGHKTHVLDRATGQALAFGAGLHEEHGFPADPVILSGHRDTHFKILETLKEGDTFQLEGLHSTRRYEVIETRIFDLREGSLQMPPKGHALLITCWPFGALAPNTPKRFLVLAAEVQPSETDATARTAGWYPPASDPAPSRMSQAFPALHPDW